MLGRLAPYPRNLVLTLLCPLYVCGFIAVPCECLHIF
jgi:hypothetical protein